MKKVKKCGTTHKKQGVIVYEGEKHTNTDMGGSTRYYNT